MSSMFSIRRPHKKINVPCNACLMHSCFVSTNKQMTRKFTALCFSWFSELHTLLHFFFYFIMYTIYMCFILFFFYHLSFCYCNSLLHMTLASSKFHTKIIKLQMQYHAKSPLCHPNILPSFGIFHSSEYAWIFEREKSVNFKWSSVYSNPSFILFSPNLKQICKKIFDLLCILLKHRINDYIQEIVVEYIKYKQQRVELGQWWWFSSSILSYEYL